MSIKDVLAGECSWHVEHGDVLEALKGIPWGSVQTVVTSPPYWMPLEYVGLPPTVWGYPKENCSGRSTHSWRKIGTWNECWRCGVWEGTLGTEPTIELWTEHIVEVFSAIKKVLRDDGTVWLNIGDAYVQSGMDKRSDAKLKPKDLAGGPWRAALALQQDGWYLRSDTIYAKTSVNPEGVTDRPQKAHEYMFLLTKSPKYFYDDHAIREALKGRSTSVWKISPHWSVDESSHFAAFPPALVEPCVVAGTPEKGVCPKCGTPWVREVEVSYEDEQSREAAPSRRGIGTVVAGARPTMRLQTGRKVTTTTGWRLGCNHGEGEPMGAVVLDPFSGTGTTGVVARRLGRRYIGVELSEEYRDFSLKRIEEDQPLLNAPCEGT